MNEPELSKTPAQVVYYMPAQPTPPDDEVSLIDLWRTLMHYKWLIIALMLLAGLSAYAVVQAMTPVFKVETVLVSADQKDSGQSKLAGLAALGGLDIGGSSNVDQVLAIFKSRPFLAGFIERENLLPLLFPDQWDATGQAWHTEPGEKAPTLENGYEKLNKLLVTAHDKKTSLVRVSMEWTDAGQAATWLNKLVEQFNQHRRKQAITEAQDTIGYLNKQLTQTNVLEMQQMVYRLIEEQTKTIMLAKVRDEFAFRIIEPAVPPEKPAKPKKRLVVAVSVMAGLMFGVFLAFFLAFLNKQRSGAETRSATGPA